MFKKVALLSLVLFLLALIFSGLALRILEWILGSSFSGKFTGERWTFCILILGGAFYALANTEYYLLILKRKQSFVFIGYGIASLLSFFTVNPVVAMGGFFYGSLHFLSMMVFLFLFFFVTGHGKEKPTTIPFFSQKPMLKCQKEVGNAGKSPKSEAKL